MALNSLPSELIKKIRSGQRLSVADAHVLYESQDLLTLGELANEKRQALHQDKTYYIVNRHIDYSNICILSCRFCAFYRRKGDDGAFEFSTEDILTKIREAVPFGITEIHMVGGFHPSLTWDYYLDTLKAVKKEFPQIHIKAFTAAEIRYFSRKFKKTETEVLKELMAAGLDSMPGGGAEIFDEVVRKEICGPKGEAQYWIDTHKLAHSLGLKSNATMLYGHIENLSHRIDHMNRIRELQDETGGFMSFIPLSFNPKDTEYESRGYTTGIDDLKTLAVARLFMDNIPHIKAYWIMSGVETAQLAQNFGADDLHGTVMEENITHMAGAIAPELLPETRLHKLITEAGRVPVQRDSLYNTLKIYQ